MRLGTVITGLVLGFLWAVAPAAAQEQPKAENGAKGTRIMLDQTAVREVEQDTLVAMLQAHAEAPEPRAAQDQVNQAIEQAIATAATAAGVRRATGGYRVYQKYDAKGNTDGWIAEQDLRLTGSDAAEMLDLVGQLQDRGLLLQGLAYELSRQAREALEAELTSQAIEQVRARAEAIAATLDTTVARIETLRIGGVDVPPPMPRMMEMRAAQADSMAPPSALPDLETVTVRVEAEVALAPR
jgi:predicted secreted protein